MLSECTEVKRRYVKKKMMERIKGEGVLKRGKSKTGSGIEIDAKMAVLGYAQAENK